MNYQLFSAAFGFTVWLTATLIFRFWGHTFFLIENYALLGGFFLGTIPILYFLSQSVYNSFGLTGAGRIHSAVLMTIPGMIGDVVCLKFHELVFPTLTIEQAIVLGAWILWAYVIILIIGINQFKKPTSILNGF